jgi:hypothetical protein
VVEGGDEALAFDNGWLFGMALLAEVTAQLDDAGLAESLYPRLAPFHDHVAAAAGEALAGSVSRSLGQLAAVLGRFEDGERHFTDALAVHTGMGANVWVAHTQHDYAAMLVRRGRTAGVPCAVPGPRGSGFAARRDPHVGPDLGGSPMTSAVRPAVAALGVGALLDFAAAPRVVYLPPVRETSATSSAISVR